MHLKINPPRQIDGQLKACVKSQKRKIGVKGTTDFWNNEIFYTKYAIFKLKIVSVPNPAATAPAANFHFGVRPAAKRQSVGRSVPDR